MYWVQWMGKIIFMGYCMHSRERSLDKSQECFRCEEPSPTPPSCWTGEATVLGCIMNPLTLGKPLSKCLPIIVISKYPHNPDRFVNAENVEKSFSHWQPCSALGVNQILNRSPESGLSLKVTHQIRTLGLDEDYCHLPIPPKLIFLGNLGRPVFLTVPLRSGVSMVLSLNWRKSGLH